MLRLQGQIASALDVARAQGQLATTQALQTDLLANRAVLQHAIAVLVDANPSSFSISEEGRRAVGGTGCADRRAFATA